MPRQVFTLWNPMPLILIYSEQFSHLMKHIGLEMEVSMGQWTNKLSAAVLYPILVAFVKETPLDCFGHAQLDSHIRSDPYITWSSTTNVLAVQPVLVCLPEANHDQLCWCACTWCAWCSGVFTRGQACPGGETGDLSGSRVVLIECVTSSARAQH